jgi:hypothetical protein
MLKWQQQSSNESPSGRMATRRKKFSKNPIYNWTLAKNGQVEHGTLPE